MKKSCKIFSLVLLFMLLMPGLTVYAEAAVPLYDDAEVLTENEYVDLSDKLEGIRTEYNVDTVVVITAELYGETAMEAADDIYDENDFGMGDNDDGILLYISTDAREYHISTHAYGMEVFNENGIQYIEDQITPFLKDSDYYGAANEFADTAEELLEMAANGEPYDEKPAKHVAIAFLVAILLPIIIAFALTFYKLSQMNTANKQTYANDYMKPGSMNIEFSRDIFLYSHIDKRKKPESSNSGSHTSSSGRTHGGGGGSF